MLFVIKEVSQIEIAVAIDLHAWPALLVVVELAFKELPFLQIDASSFPPLALHLSEVDLVVTLHQLQSRTIQQWLSRYSILWKWLIRSKILAELILRQVPNGLRGSELFDCVHSEDFDLQARFLALHVAALVGEGYVHLWIFVELALAPHNKFKSHMSTKCKNYSLPHLQTISLCPHTSLH